MRLKHLGAIALSAAAFAALGPASAGAATSSACAGGAFRVTLPGGKTLAPGQSAKLAASALPAGSRLHVQGRYVQFDVSVSDFSVYDWALTGAANPDDLTGGRFTPIWASKVADLKGATLNRELEVKPTDAAGSGLLLQRSGSAKMKIQAKDCATGGVFQIEGEVGSDAGHLHAHPRPGRALLPLPVHGQDADRQRRPPDRQGLPDGGDAPHPDRDDVDLVRPVRRPDGLRARRGRRRDHRAEPGQQLHAAVPGAEPDPRHAHRAGRRAAGRRDRTAG